MTMALTQVSDNGLTNTGVTAATYGSSSAIPSLTIDAKGRVTSASTSAIDSTSIANGTSNVSVANNSDITVTHSGTTVGTFTGNSLDLNDSIFLRLGNAQDLRLYHDGSNSFIQDAGSGDLYIRGSNNLYLQNAGGTETYVACTNNGQVELYNDNLLRLQTATGGVNVTGTLIASTNVEALNNMHVGDGKKYLAGNSNDLEIYHDGTHSNIVNLTGDLYIQGSGDDIIMRAADDIFIQVQNGEDGIKVHGNGSVELYHDNNNKLQTTSSGVNVTGSITCDGLVVDGTFKQSNGTGALVIQDDNNTGNNVVSYVQGVDSSSSQKWYVGYGNSSNQDLYVSNSAGGQIQFQSSGTTRFTMQAAGHLVPETNNAIDLGTSSNRWRNLYTNDLNLSNEGSANDVDGTWGNFTIQEGEDDLFLINRRSGKKYKFNLTEVN